MTMATMMKMVMVQVTMIINNHDDGMDGTKYIDDLDIRCDVAGIILCMRPAIERWRYIITSSLIGWARTKKDPCVVLIDTVDTDVISII